VIVHRFLAILGARQSTKTAQRWIKAQLQWLTSPRLLLVLPITAALGGNFMPLPSLRRCLNEVALSAAQLVCVLLLYGICCRRKYPRLAKNWLTVSVQSASLTVIFSGLRFHLGPHLVPSFYNTRCSHRVAGLLGGFAFANVPPPAQSYCRANCARSIPGCGRCGIGLKPSVVKPWQSPGVHGPGACCEGMSLAAARPTSPCVWGCSGLFWCAYRAA